MRKLIITVLILIGLVVPLYLKRQQVEDPPQETPKTSAATILKYQREAWLGALIWCESRGNPGAVNPKDKDGTQSWGLAQFKPDTFKRYREKYGLPEADLMDPEAQIEIIWKMFDDPDVVWAKEFPSCVSRLGSPPK